MKKTGIHFIPFLFALAAFGQTDFAIPDGTLRVAGRAFAGCANLTSVTIPESVLEIGEDAFYRCDSLTNIAVSADNTAFASEDGILYSKNGWTLLRCPGGKTGKVTVPSSVMAISDRAFSGCGKLAEIVLPPSAFRLGRDVFYHCGSLTNIAVSEGSALYASRDGVLYSQARQATLLCCPGGKTGAIAVAEDTWYLASHAFADCKGLTAVALPSSLFGIGTNAFYRCESLTGITVNAENTLFESEDGILYAKSQMLKLLCCPAGKTGTVAVPSGVRYLADRAFAGCGKITGVSLPETLLGIGTNAFYRCGSLTNITVAEGNSLFGSRNGALYRLSRQLHLICCPGGKAGPFAIPSGIAYVDERAFAGCGKLTEVSIPSSVLKIGTNAFYRCGSLTNIAVDAENAAYTAQDGALCSRSPLPALLCCPGGKAGAFAVSSQIWTIAPRAFACADKLTEVTLPENAFTLGAEAFYRCGSLTNIAVAEGNASYRSQDGVLYTRAELPTLVCCPGGYGKESPHVTVSGVSIPCSWLENHGLVTGGDYSAAAQEDSDRDGFPAWQEYLAGTDPTNAASRLLASIGWKDGQPLVGWNVTNAAAVYTVLGRTNLTDGTDFAPANAGHRFFKVRVDPR